MLDILSKNGKPMTVAELAEKTAMAPMLTGIMKRLRRIFRHFSNDGFLQDDFSGIWRPIA